VPATLAAPRLLHSQSEWDVRNRILSSTLAGLAADGLPPGATRALDVGCQNGSLTDAYAAHLGLDWTGIDPVIESERTSRHGSRLLPGTADALPFDDAAFDLVVFANVYEHVLPDRRAASLREIRRVLKPGGLVVGQIPNPYYPIESHSRLPFMGWLPFRLQLRYWRLSPAPYEHDFFVVTPRHLRADAATAGLEATTVQRFNYPPEVMPAAFQRAARLLRRPMSWVPWAWQFVLRPRQGT
jgi:SAM-dependent methyltransferase